MCTHTTTRMKSQRIRLNKKANSERLYTSLKQKKYRNEEQISQSPGVGKKSMRQREVGMVIKGNKGDPCGDEIVLFINYLHVDILTLILPDSSPRCHHRGKLDEVPYIPSISLHYFLQLHVNLQLPQNKILTFPS